MESVNYASNQSKNPQESTTENPLANTSKLESTHYGRSTTVRIVQKKANEPSSQTIKRDLQDLERQQAELLEKLATVSDSKINQNRSLKNRAYLASIIDEPKTPPPQKIAIRT